MRISRHGCWSLRGVLMYKYLIIMVGWVGGAVLIILGLLSFSGIQYVGGGLVIVGILLIIVGIVLIALATKFYKWLKNLY